MPVFCIVYASIRVKFKVADASLRVQIIATVRVVPVVLTAVYQLVYYDYCTKISTP